MSDLIDGLSNGLENAGETILSFLPRLIGALIILVIGWLVARLVHRVFQRLFKAVGLDALLERAGLADRLNAAGYTATDLAARAIYWIALLVVFLLTAEALDVEYLSDIPDGTDRILAAGGGGDRHRHRGGRAGRVPRRAVHPVVPGTSHPVATRHGRGGR